ncbi:hypothetical protein [Streptomyces sp. NPDC088733]|uniref:hypothetical protein n=1 Tax=Streptomyces sp. NPDC088733 TaxID=3365880 RepID=UPI00380BD45D
MAGPGVRAGARGERALQSVPERGTQAAQAAVPRSDEALDEAEDGVVGARQPGRAEEHGLGVAVPGAQHQGLADAGQAVGVGTAGGGQPVRLAERHGGGAALVRPLDVGVDEKSGVGEPAAQRGQAPGEGGAQRMPVRQAVGEPRQCGDGVRDVVPPGQRGGVLGNEVAVLAGPLHGGPAEPRGPRGVEDRLGRRGGNAGEFAGHLLRQADDGAEPFRPDAAGRRDVGPGGPQCGRVLRQQGAGQGRPVVPVEGGQQRLGEVLLTRFQADGRERRAVRVVGQSGEQHRRLRGAEAAAGRRDERLRPVLAPGRRALVPQEPGEFVQPPGGQVRGSAGLLLQGEVGDGAERSGRVVVQGDPTDVLALAVDVLAGQNHHGAVAAAQDLSRSLLLVVLLAEDDLAEPAAGRRQQSLADRVEQQAQRLALRRGDGGGRRAEGQRAQPAEDGRPRQAHGGDDVLVAGPAAAGRADPVPAGQRFALGRLA